MSMFKPSGSGSSSSGISPEQLDSLQSDGEAFDQTQSLLGSISVDGGATRNAVAVTRERLLDDGQVTRDSVDALEASVLAGQTAAKTDILAGQSASQTAVLAGQTAAKTDILAGQTAAKTELLAALSAGAYSGRIDLANRTNGLATTGYTKASGIAVPDGMFSYSRTNLLPYTAGSSGMSSTNAASAFRAVINDNVFVYASAGVLRMLGLGTMNWATMPAYPGNASGAYPTTLGSVNGKLVTFGPVSGSTTSLTAYTLDYVGLTWVQRASQAAFRSYQGIADMKDGRCVLFGGKSVSDSVAESATNIVDEVRIYSDSLNTYTAKAALPVRMSRIRTAVLAGATPTVLLFPTYTSDGTTLTTPSRLVFKWTEAGGAVALDPIPAECVNTPLLMNPQADGTLVFVPSSTPSTGSRARLLNPNAASGSQWTSLDWDYNDSVTYSASPVGCESRATSSGYGITSQMVNGSSYGLTATYVGAPLVSWSQTFYQIKN